MMSVDLQVPVRRYAALYCPPRVGHVEEERPVTVVVAERPAGEASPLVKIAQAFSPRYECCRHDLVTIDITGLERLLLLRRGRDPGVKDAGRDPGVRDTGRNPGVRDAGNVRGQRVSARGGAPGVHTAIGDQFVRAMNEAGVRGHVAVATTWMAAAVLARARPGLTVVPAGDEAAALAAVPLDILVPIEPCVWPARREASMRLTTFKQWGLRTLGDLAALPSADLSARLGRHALVWQALARGEDVRPLVPTAPEERFDAALDLEWPIDGLEPLSFVLTRLLEPLSTRLERRDRGAASLHVLLQLVTRDVYARHLQLPTPMRDVRALRTLALLDLEAHPPPASIDRVEIVIDPTPGRVVQHTLFTRARPTPERLSTLLARLSALMGQDRIGAPATVDTFRPGAFELRAFSTDSKVPVPVSDSPSPTPPESAAPHPLSALRRCRQPVPARVALEGGRPVRVTTDRRGFCGGAVVSASGPWRTSGWWWASPCSSPPPSSVPLPAWNREEWEVALSDGAVYRMFHECEGRGWFIDGVFD